MRTNLISAFVVLLTLSTSVPIVIGQQGIGPDGRMATEFEERVTVTFDPRVLPISQKSINELIQSKDVIGAAAREIAGKPVEFKQNLGGFGTSQAWAVEDLSKWYAAYAYLAGFPENTRNELLLKIPVYVNGASDKGEAKRFAALVTKRLDLVLRELSERAHDRHLQDLKAAAEQAQANVDLARQRLEVTRSKVQQVSSPLSESVLQELVSDLKKQQQALEIELAGMKGRAEALQSEVAKTAARAKKEPADDDVMQNLKRVVELRTQQLKSLIQLHQSGAVPQGEIAKAEEQVALAQVSLAEARRSTSRQASDLLEKLNGDLSAISVGVAENEAKLKYVKKRLDEYAAELGQEAEAKPLRQQLERETKTLANVQAQADQAAADVRQLESSFHPARVEVFELAPKDEKPTDGEKEKP